MKRFGSALVLALVLLPLGVASADTMSISQTIHLTGVVPPMRNIVVDGRGDIIEITSNTPEAVTPQVYMNTLKAGNEAPLTPSILKDYKAKTQGVDMHSTDLHLAVPISRTGKSRSQTPQSILGRISVLRLDFSRLL